ncbi:MAG: hypothetical protein WCZ23_04180 [Rhodospirillaceae bacterium]
MKRILLTTTAAIGVAVLALSAIGGAVAQGQPGQGPGMGYGMGGGHHMMRDMSPEDIAARRAEMFKAMDANSDGTLTQEEYTNREKSPTWTAYRDARRQERHNERFTGMDTNKDGSISADEFRAYHDQLRSKGPGAKRQ